jgi:hypothetical protein
MIEKKLGLICLMPILLLEDEEVWSGETAIVATSILAILKNFGVVFLVSFLTDDVNSCLGNQKFAIF